MHKTILLIAFMLIPLIQLRAQSSLAPTKVGKEHIPWTSDYKLKWSDFKGVKDTTNSAYDGMLAACASDIRVTSYYETGSLKFEVINLFYPYDSWVTDSVTMGEFGLAHEQLHFDIAELYARKIRKGLADLAARTGAEVEGHDILIRTLLMKRTLRNELYDKETGNGSVDFMQEKWEKLIRQEIEELAAYAEDSKKIKKKTTHNNRIKQGL